MRVAWLCLLLVAQPAWAIVGGQPPAEDDRRFDAVGAWSRAGWLGLGNNPDFEHNWFGGATLIRANMVATAKHIAEDENAPAGTYAVRFRRRIDGGLGRREQGVFSYHHALVQQVIHGPGDLALAILSEPVTHISPIAVMQMGFRGLDDAPFIHAGWGQEGPGREEGPRNQLLLCDQNRLVRVGLTSVAYPSLAQEGGPPCAVNRWDSGGAVLVEEQDRLWLLASHQSYYGGPTLAPWLDHEAYRAVVHRGFSTLDLALESVSLAGDEVPRGASLTATVQISNPGLRRLGGQAPELVAELTQVGQDDWRAEVGRVALDRNWASRQRRSVEVEVAFAEDLPVGLFQVTLRLVPNGDDGIERNNQLVVGSPVVVSARREPFVALRAATLARPGDNETFDLVHLIHVERYGGSQGLWLFARQSSGEVSFAAQNAHAPAGSVRLETPWGVFGYDPDTPREPTLVPEGFSGQFSAAPQGLYRAFVGLYHGGDESRGDLLVALTTSGGVIGGIAQPDGTALLINHAFADGQLSAEGSGHFANGTQGMRLAWLEARDGPHLDLLFADDERVRLWREEEPAAAHAPCRNRWACVAQAGNAAMQCYRAEGQIYGVCEQSACVENQDNCDAQSTCVAELDQCVPRCTSDETCPGGMRCTFDGRCLDCTVHVDLCTPPDAGPPADTGVTNDLGQPSDSGVSDVNLGDAGMLSDAGPADDMGSVAPVPGPGCSCHGAAPAGTLIWLLPWAFRRRFKPAKR